MFFRNKSLLRPKWEEKFMSSVSTDTLANWVFWKGFSVTRLTDLCVRGKIKSHEESAISQNCSVDHQILAPDLVLTRHFAWENLWWWDITTHCLSEIILDWISKNGFHGWGGDRNTNKRAQRSLPLFISAPSSQLRKMGRKMKEGKQFN